MPTRNDRIYLFDPVSAYDACGLSVFHLNPAVSEYGNEHRGEEGRIEVFWARIPSSGQWLFFEVGPAEECLHEQVWYAEMVRFAWYATELGSGYCSLYIPREDVSKLKDASQLADDHAHMVLWFLDHLSRHNKPTPGSQ